MVGASLGAFTTFECRYSDASSMAPKIINIKLKKKLRTNVFSGLFLRECVFRNEDSLERFLLSSSKKRKRTLPEITKHKSLNELFGSSFHNESVICVPAEPSALTAIAVKHVC